MSAVRSWFFSPGRPVSVHQVHHPTLATHRYIIISNPMLPKHLFSIESRKGMPIVYVNQDDGIAREVRVQRTLCTWLMATGGANADRSQSFYVPPGVDKVTIEIPFTHNEDIAVHRYHGDWLSKVAADAELLPSGTTDWAVWPGGAALVLAQNPVAAGSYALERMLDATGAVVVFDVHAGWYRLVATAAGLDKTFTVCYEIP